MTDTFRKVYKPMHPENSALVTKIKETLEQVELLFSLVNNREMSIAKTNLEQASMWATKAIVLEDEKNGGEPIAGE